MAKLLSSSAPKSSQYLSWLSQRYFACGHGGRWSEPSQCKSRKIPKAEPKCQPKEGSCCAMMGACPKKNFRECSEPLIKPPAHLSCCSDKRLTETPCSKPEKKMRTEEEKNPFVSMWATFGLEKQCPDAAERLDETLYQPTDIKKRTYTQTWQNCVPVERKRKICCTNEICLLPPISKRHKAEKPQTAKEKDVKQLKEDYDALKKCLQQKVVLKQIGKTKCQKITMPCCRRVAKNLKCHKSRKTECTKECCPYPSFSECDHAQLEKGLSSECRCLHFSNQCDANRFLGRKQFFSLPPPLPAWPPK